MGVSHHFVAYLVLERLNHVGAGANGAVLHVLAALYVQNNHGGISQACSHVRIRLFRLNGNSACRIISGNHRFKIQELLRSGRTFLTGFTNPVQILFNFGSGHFSAVAELDTFFQFEDPGLVTVAGSSGFCQLRNRFYIIVKFKQGLANAKTAAVPGSVGLSGRIDTAVGVHLATKDQRFGSRLAVFAGISLLVTAAAAGQQTAGNKTCYQ